jgi:hypothetical protein
MGIVRPNEELLLMACKSVSELGEDDLQRLGFQKTTAISYRYDGEGNVYKDEAEAVKDEELGVVVRTENYYVANHLLERLSLSIIEQDANFPDEKTQKRKGKGGSRTRKSQKNGGKKRRRFEWGREQKFTCGVWLNSGCESCDYTYWMKAPCDREWCPECGKPNSLYHRRLYLQLLKIALDMFAMGGAVGYMVITCTEELREKWKDPDKLREFREYLRQMLQREGFRVVLYRWHFAGDKGRRWYPHLNLLFPLGYIEKEKLERVRRLIERRTGIKILKYQYTRSLSKIRHWVRYISRPTWNLQNEVSPERFRYFRKWGVWGEGLIVDYDKIPNKHEQEEFWMAFGLLVSSLVQKNKENKVYEEVEELINAILKLARGTSGEGVEELKNEALRIREGGGSLKARVRRLFDKLLEIRGYPALYELAGFIILHGRCIGCFRKLKWKWRKSPFITREHKVFKVGWGVWVVVDKECEDEEFPF